MLPMVCSPVEHGEGLLLQCMLGLLPCQAEFEALYSRHCSDPPGLLANRCLATFTSKTGVGIVDKSDNLRLARVRLVVQPSRRGLTRARDGVPCTDLRVPLYRYSPAYTQLTGYDVATATYSEEVLAVQRQDLLTNVVAEFWEHVHAQLYMPDPQLQKQVKCSAYDPESRMLSCWRVAQRQGCVGVGQRQGCVGVGQGQGCVGVGQGQGCVGVGQRQGCVGVGQGQGCVGVGQGQGCVGVGQGQGCVGVGQRQGCVGVGQGAGMCGCGTEAGMCGCGTGAGMCGCGTGGRDVWVWDRGRDVWV